MTKDISTTDAKRPLSPHLSIYRPQISSVLSILHRITGVALYVGMLVLAWWVVAGVYAKESVNAEIWKLAGHPVGMILMAGWSFALFYHLLNGVRHLFWDMGKGFEVCVADRSGWLVVIGSLVLTGVSWYIALMK